MQIHVYDTYVKSKDGHTMHFDVFTAVKDDQKAVEYARQWLVSIDEGDAVNFQQGMQILPQPGRTGQCCRCN